MHNPRAIGIYLSDRVACAAWVAETGCTSMLANDEGLVLWAEAPDSPAADASSKLARLNDALRMAGADLERDSIAIVTPQNLSVIERREWMLAATKAGLATVTFPSIAVAGAVALMEATGELAPDTAGRSLTIVAESLQETVTCSCRGRVLRVLERARSSAAPPPLPIHAVEELSVAVTSSNPPRDAFDAHWTPPAPVPSSSAPPAPLAALPSHVDFRIVVGDGNSGGRHAHPLEAIARGAAHVANHTVQIFDLAANSLGATVIENGQPAWRPLIANGARLPARVTISFAALSPFQRALSIPLSYRSENGDEAFAGLLTVNGLAGNGAEPSAAVVDLDLPVNGRITVQCRSGNSNCHPALQTENECEPPDLQECLPDAEALELSEPDSSPWEMFLPRDFTTEPEHSGGNAGNEAAPDVESAGIDYLESRPQTFRRSQPEGLSPFKQGLIFLVGLVFFSGLGLAIGYYILVWLRPEANLLELDLPGLSSPPLRLR